MHQTYEEVSRCAAIATCIAVRTNDPREHAAAAAFHANAAFVAMAYGKGAAHIEHAASADLHRAACLPPLLLRSAGRGCACPDHNDPRRGRVVCKHIIAAMLTQASEAVRTRVIEMVGARKKASR